jgi:hypothetical protein
MCQMKKTYAYVHQSDHTLQFQNCKMLTDSGPDLYVSGVKAVPTNITNKNIVTLTGRTM